MRYNEISRVAYLQRDFESTISTLVESPRDFVQSILGYVQRNNVQPQDAKHIVSDYVKQFANRGGTVNKAKQELTKLSTKKGLVLGCLLLAAAIGTVLTSNSNDSTASLDSKLGSAVQQIEPQVTKLQKQTPVISSTAKTELANVERNSDSREQYQVETGDSTWKIAAKLKPDNVEIDDYISLLDELNDGKKLIPGATIDIPNKHDMKNVALPDIHVKFKLSDKSLIKHLKEAEGTIESQSNTKRRLLNGKVGPSYKNGKFYPYRDPHGYWTIGYGHLISKTSAAAARKYEHGITEHQANAMLQKDMERVYDDFVLLLKRKRATNLPSSIQKALFEMTYNLGAGGLSQFNEMWRHLKAGRFEKASQEMIDSAWGRQVQNSRVSRLSGAIAKHSKPNLNQDNT